jgi:multicomponent Na+:H+ antiporter subunit E
MKLLSPSRWWQAIGLASFFLVEVVVANLQVARLVFVSNEKIDPAIVKLPLRVESDLEIFLLTSMITLTPGTLSLSVTDDRKELFVHVIHAPDPAAVVRSIQDGFERRILGVFQ